MERLLFPHQAERDPTATYGAMAKLQLRQLTLVQAFAWLL